VSGAKEIAFLFPPRPDTWGLWLAFSGRGTVGHGRACALGGFEPPGSLRTLRPNEV